MDYCYGHNVGDYEKSMSQPDTAEKGPDVCLSMLSCLEPEAVSVVFLLRFKVVAFECSPLLRTLRLDFGLVVRRLQLLQIWRGWQR